MSFWIICFDPWSSLKPPVPALYPEWGERFFHCPLPLSEAQRKTLEWVLESRPQPPQCWLLTPASVNAEAYAQALAQIRTLWPGLEPPTPLRWRIPQALQQTAEEPSPGISLDLVLDDNLESANPARVVGLLLPLALRFYMDHKRLLQDCHAPSLKRITLRTSSLALNAPLQDLKTRLNESARHGRSRMEELEQLDFEGMLFDTQHLGFAETLKLNPPDPFRLGLWHQTWQDEQAASQWMRGATDRVLRDCQQFSQRLEEWRQETLRILHRQTPSLRQSGISPKSLQRKLKAELEPLPPASANEGLSSKAEQLCQTQTLALVRALRNRPRRGLFLGFALGLLPLVGLLASLGSAWAAPIPSLWQGLPLALWLLASFGCLGLAQWPIRQAEKAAQNQLHQLSLLAETQSDQHKNLANAQLRNLIRYRNLDRVEAEIHKRQRQRQQWEYHLSRMQAVLDGFGLGRLQEGQQTLQGFEFDPTLPETLSRAYQWSGGCIPELWIGQDRAVLQDPAGRLGGIETLIINGPSP